MKKINQKELHSIFKKLKDKDELAFNELYEKYQSLVYRISFSILKDKEDSEEIVQSIFLKIFQLEREKLPSQYETSWLYTITKNEAISFLRKNKETIALDTIYEIEGNDSEIDKTIDKIKFNQLISRLTNIEKEIISLKIISDLSFREIAKLLNKPLGTIKWKYYKAVNTLKMLLGNLAMFVITFLIGLCTIPEKESYLEENQQEESKNEEEKDEQKEEQKKEETNREETQIKDITEEVNEIMQETVIQTTQSSKEETPYYAVGAFSISAVFFIISIIFFIFFLKYRLKEFAKSSKK